MSRRPATAVPSSSSTPKKPEDTAVDVLLNHTLVPERIEHNNRIIEVCRTYLAIMVGIATGLLGFTGLQGFFTFFASSLAVSFLLLLKTKFIPSPYGLSLRGLFLGGLLQGFGSFVLFWVMAYDIVHIYS